MADFLTVIRAVNGARMTKIWTDDGIQPYENAKTFEHRREAVSDLWSLAEVFSRLRGSPTECIIRGAFSQDTGTSERNTASTRDAAHHWIMVDVDDFEPIADPLRAAEECCKEFVAARLPPEFQEVSFFYNLSSSAGAPGKEHLLKAHLWFWLEDAVTCGPLRAWAKHTPGVDAAVFRQVQPHYTADPVFTGRTQNPTLCPRSGICPGVISDTVPTTFLQATTDIDRLQATTDVDLDSVRSVVPDYDLDAARALLEELDPNMDHDTWVQVGMALHHQGDAGSDWLELWDEWSSGGATWQEGQCAERWKSFQGDHAGGGVTLRFVMKLAGDQRQRAAVKDAKRTNAAKLSARPVVDAALDSFLSKIAGASTPVALELDLAPEIRLVAWSDTDRSALVEAIWGRLRALGTPLGRRAIGKWIAPVVAAAAPAPGASWVKDWAYVEREKRMFNVVTRELLDRDGFNMAMTHRVPLAPGSTVPMKAFDYAMAFERPICASAVYAPPHDATFSWGGLLFANRYQPDLLPADGPGAEYVAVIESFFARLVPDDRERSILLSWLAYNVRRPGVKIGWSPYLHSSVHGVGKTTIAQLMSAVMGPRAVGVYKGSVLYSRFSGWETECALAMLDEFPDASGRGADGGVDPYEQVKVVITSSEVAIERKGRDLIVAPSFCNVIIVSNSLTAFRVNANDRRLFYVSVPMTKDEQAGLEASGFYTSVHWAIKQGAGALRAWLLGLPLDREFKVSARAPETLARAEAIEMSKSNLRTDIEDLLDRKGPGFNGKVVSSGHLRAALGAHIGGRREPPGCRAIDFVLREIGYSRAGKVRLSGRTCNAWYAGPRSGTEEENRLIVAEQLRASLGVTDGDEFLE